MEKAITIDGKEVKFRATAAVPRLYRIKFRRDIIQDIDVIKKAMKRDQEDGESIPPQALEMFENVAFIMAKHAAPDAVPSTPDEWLDTFNTFSIYQIFPEIVDLWDLNMAGTSKPKKK